MIRRLPVFCLVASLALATVTLASAQITFTQNAINSGDSGAYSIAAGDFNNDGIIDLVTVNTITVSFYKGLGGGKFAAPVDETLFQGLGQVAVADVNKDGRLDLVVASNGAFSNDYVTILLGNGDGTFTQGTSVTVEGSASYITLADFNGDHIPDIAVGDSLATKTEIFLGNGDGTFRQSQVESYGGDQIVAGDFNADGHQDLAVVLNDNAGIALFLGNGDGTFQSPIIASLSGVTSIAIGDFYNDRIQTLAALVNVINQGNLTGTYVYSLQYSKGELLVQNQNKLGAGSGYGTFLAGGDLNGDFKDDIFLVGSSENGKALSYYMLGNGNGTFNAPVSAPGAGETQMFPIIRDLNLDSRHDVAIAYSEPSGDTDGANILLNKNAAVHCAPPGANQLSVHVCAPASGQTVGKTFTFKAGGNAFNGIAKRTELWIDNKKVAQNLEDQLNATVTLSEGTHTAAFVVVDSFDNYVSQDVSFKASY